MTIAFSGLIRFICLRMGFCVACRDLPLICLSVFFPRQTLGDFATQKNDVLCCNVTLLILVSKQIPNQQHTGVIKKSCVGNVTTVVLPCSNYIYRFIRNGVQNRCPLHCKNIRRFYGKITGNQLPVLFPYYLQAPVNIFRNQT